MTTKKKPSVKYSPDWCDTVLDLGRQGMVLSSYATRLNMSVQQMQTIMKTKPEFAQAVEVAMSYALSYHEEQLVMANQTKGAQPQLTLAFLKSNWPSKYANTDAKTSGGGRGDKQQQETINQEYFEKEITKLLEILINASADGDITEAHRDRAVSKLNSCSWNKDKQ